MSGMPWIKLYTEILDDVKLARLEDAQKWRFIQLLALAGECDAAGWFVTGDSLMTLADIAWRLRCDTKTLQNDIVILLNTGLLAEDEEGLCVTKWSDRQGPTQDEKRKSWRNRQEKRRNSVKSRIVTGESPVTHVNVTPLEEEEDKEKEEEPEPPTPARFSDEPMVRIIESVIGITLNSNDLPAIKEMEDMNALEVDIRGGYDWLKSKEKTVSRASQLVGPTRTAMAKRLNPKGNGKAQQFPESRPVSEVYHE